MTRPQMHLMICNKLSAKLYSSFRASIRVVLIRSVEDQVRRTRSFGGLGPAVLPSGRRVAGRGGARVDLVEAEKYAYFIKIRENTRSL